MTHSKVTIRALAMLQIVVAACAAAVAQTAPSVPNLIAYQGLVTLAGGSPVANGSYPAIFTIYNYSSGGASLWSENGNVTTNAGRFTHNLGSVAALPAALSSSYDSLWLEVTFNGELLTPRSRLVANAYSLTANTLEGNNGAGVVSLRANAHQISQYGSDGGEQIRLWGPAYSELVMDGIAIDYVTDDILLSTNGSAGSILRLRKPGGTSGAVLHSGGSGGGASLNLTNDVGTSTIFMDGDLSSDASVVLPGGAISAIEQVNEPGVASDIVTGSLTLTPGFNVLASRTIVAPSSGYVLAIGSCYIRSFATDSLQLGISTSSSSLPTSQQLNVNLSFKYLPVTVHGSFPIDAGAQTYYFLAYEEGGTSLVTNRTITLVFVPTAYGTFDSPAAPMGAGETTGKVTPGSELAESVAANESRLNGELELIRIQAREQSERIRKLEEAEAKRGGTEQSLISPEH